MDAFIRQNLNYGAEIKFSKYSDGLVLDETVLGKLSVPMSDAACASETNSNMIFCTHIRDTSAWVINLLNNYGNLTTLGSPPAVGHAPYAASNNLYGLFIEGRGDPSFSSEALWSYRLEQGYRMQIQNQAYPYACCGAASWKSQEKIVVYGGTSAGLFTNNAWVLDYPNVWQSIAAVENGDAGRTISTEFDSSVWIATGVQGQSRFQYYDKSLVRHQLIGRTFATSVQVSGNTKSYVYFLGETEGLLYDKYSVGFLTRGALCTSACSVETDNILKASYFTSVKDNFPCWICVTDSMNPFVATLAEIPPNSGFAITCTSRGVYLGGGVGPNGEPTAAVYQYHVTNGREQTLFPPVSYSLRYKQGESTGQSLTKLVLNYPETGKLVMHDNILEG